jgi:hypothetical protein
MDWRPKDLNRLSVSRWTAQRSQFRLFFGKQFRSVSRFVSLASSDNFLR